MTSTPPVPIVPGPPENTTPQPLYLGAPPARSRGVPTLVAIALAAGGLAVGCIGGVALGGGQNEPAAKPPAAAPTTQTAPVTTKPAAPAVTTPAAPAAPAAVTVEDGTWTVGPDLPAGTYRVTTNVSSDCYWAITKSGTNGETFIANDLPGGGRPTVILKAGQDFRSSNCGTWAKVG